MVSSIGPVHPDTREAEFKQIKKGSYNVYVEVHVSNIVFTVTVLV